MNIDIKNYGHFRLTNHGGKRYELFNRRADEVLSINQSEFEYINQSDSPFMACVEVDHWYQGKRKKSNAIDVA